jgi:hypothetical protein
MDEGSDNLVVYPSRWKAAAVFAGALLFVALGVAFHWFREDIRIGTGTLLITSYVGVPFFGRCAAYALYRLTVRRHEGDDSVHGFWLGQDFEDYVDRLSLLGCFGSEDWQLSPIVSGPRSLLETNSANATNWRDRFGLRLPGEL